MAWEIALIIFLLSLTVLLYMLIPVIFNLRNTLKKVNGTLDVLNDDLPEILENVKDISGVVTSISGKIEDTIDDVIEIEQMVSKEIKVPLQNIANSIGLLLQLVNKIFDKRSSKD